MKYSKILFLLTSLMVVSISWVGFNVYHTLNTSTISEEVNKQITPISPDFDLQTIEKIKEKQIVSPLYSNSTQIQPEESPTGQTASQSGDIGGAQIP